MHWLIVDSVFLQLDNRPVLMSRFIDDPKDTNILDSSGSNSSAAETIFDSCTSDSFAGSPGDSSVPIDERPRVSATSWKMLLEWASLHIWPCKGAQ